MPVNHGFTVPIPRTITMEQAVRGLLKKMENMALFVPYMEKCELLSKDESKNEWTTKITFKHGDIEIIDAKYYPPSMVSH